MFDTGFINKHFKPELLSKYDEKEEEIASLFAAKLFLSLKPKLKSENQASENTSQWKRNRTNES